MAEFVGIGLAVFGVGYAIKSALSARKKFKKNKEYRKKVIEYTVKRGYSIQSNYNNLEKKIESREVTFNSYRNPKNNVVYSTLSQIIEQHDENGNYIEINDEYNLLEDSPLV